MGHTVSSAHSPNIPAKGVCWVENTSCNGPWSVDRSGIAAKQIKGEDKCCQAGSRSPVPWHPLWVQPGERKLGANGKFVQSSPQATAGRAGTSTEGFSIKPFCGLQGGDRHAAVMQRQWAPFTKPLYLWLQVASLPGFLRRELEVRDSI